MNNQKSTSTLPERSYDQADNTVTQTAKGCNHHFVMKGIKTCECLNCHVGYFVNDIEDFKKLKNKFGIIE